MVGENAQDQPSAHDNLASMLAEVRDELRALRRDVSRAELLAERWRALEVLLQPVSAMGFFGMGLAVPLLMDALQAQTMVHAVSNVVAGILILGIAMVSIGLPLSLQSYFLAKPTRMSSFFKELEGTDGRNVLSTLQAWAARQPDAARPVRVAIAQARFLANVGLWAFLLMLVAVITTYYAVLLLVVLREGGILAFVAAGVAVTASAGAATIILLRRWRRRGGGAAAGEPRGVPSASRVRR